VWPLPPAGPLVFVCEWPALGVEESRAQLDARLVLDAAARSRPLWPEQPQATGEDAASST
jgi:hypothetical protein